MATRREFITITAGALAARAAGLQAAVTPAGSSLDILVLGGTGFLGPHQINHALARGHRVTMFNRGTNAGMFGDAVEELVGDRDSRKGKGLSALEGDRMWDVVIDNSGYVPRHVRDSVELLKDRCRRYIYVSTVSVYDFDAAEVFPESARLAELEDPSVEEITGATYGPLKAECDRLVREILGARSTVVRPTYVVGPGDRTDRFTYWVDRVHRGGEVLAPAGPAREAQWVDARDLCPWIITLAEADTPGVFNAAGPASRVDRLGLLWGLRAMTDQPVEFYWPDDALLEELDISMPMMAPGDDSYHVANEASMQAGLVYRSLADTASGTLDWWHSQSEERRQNARRWPSAEQERAAIERLKKA
jgi:2'-hydroxyisoflavone reductase